MPKNLVSRGMGRLARAAWPKALLRAALRAYVRVYGVDMREAAKPLHEFESFTQFFTRELRDGARPVSADNIGKFADLGVGSD